MKISDILAKWKARRRTPAEILQDEITRHNAEVECRKSAKKLRKAGVKAVADRVRVFP